MKSSPIAHQPQILAGHGHMIDQFKAWAKHVVSLSHQALDRRGEQEPTLEHIVDRIMASACDGCCEVRLNPRITRVDNLKWLLPICVQQFGATIAISEHVEGDQVVLTIQITDRKYTKHRQPTRSGEQDRVPLVVGGR